MNFILGQTGMVDIPANAPLWVTVLVILVPTILSLIAFFRSRSDGKWKSKAMDLQNKNDKILAEHEKELASFGIMEKLIDIQATSSASNDANAERHHKEATAFRESLDRNTDVMSNLVDVSEGIKPMMDNVDKSLNEAKTAGEDAISSNKALHTDVSKALTLINTLSSTLTNLSDNMASVAKQSDIESLRTTLSELQTEISDSLRGLKDSLDKSDKNQALKDSGVQDQTENV